MVPAPPYDAVVVVSFGGPEGPDDVMPFLENVLRGRSVPRARVEEVAEHYRIFGGVSPINGINRALVSALTAELVGAGHDLPVYWGNRNWRPYLADEVRRMRDDGVRRALAFVTSAYGSYSSCRQYLDDIDAARAATGDGAPAIDKLRLFYNHPRFFEVWVESLDRALTSAGGEPAVLFSAHSIPVAMASTCGYEAQLTETARLVASGAGLAGEGLAGWQMVWQSGSGPPGQPWLEPDLTTAIESLPEGTEAVVVAPIGFVSDHMEVVYDIDHQAAAVAARRGLRLVRAATPGTDPRFVTMIRELIEERLDPASPRPSPGSLATPPVCTPGCCPRPVRPAEKKAASGQVFGAELLGQ
ncbi:MAG TPA: ferrochelatase [Acidimicrobiales bacterium]|nr:ferrochelatase [Acidimicrobiales bacterium]